MSDERPTKAMIYRLKEIKAGTAEKPPTVAPDGKPIPVQFNPTSLKIERNNDSSGAANTRGQRRNQPNEGHATLSLELEFDTAEGGPDGEPLDVRVRTQDLRQFTEPPAKDRKKAPPRMRFVWGKFTFDGIVSRISEDIDYFDINGMALRAKVGLSITGQDEAFESNATAPGARTDGSKGRKGNGPGKEPSKSPDMAADAQDSESVQQALGRLGLDPAAWRSAMTGLSSPLALSAGMQLQVDTAATAGVGLGVATGFSAGLAAGASVGVSAAAAAGLAAGVTAGATAGVTAGASAGFAAGGAAGLSIGGAFAGAEATAAGAVGASEQESAGFALSAVGGIDAAAQGVLAAQVGASVTAARGSFAVPGTVAPGPSGPVAARVDTRSVSYGRGVPLKPRPVVSTATLR